MPAQPSFRESLARARQQQLPVISLLSAVTGDHQEAAELALKAFVHAARRRAPDEAASTTELLREALRVIESSERTRQLRRKREREEDQPEFDLPDGEIPEPFGASAEAPQEVLMASLARLPRLRRHIFLLDRAAGVPPDQIARVCGISVKRVRQELEEMPEIPGDLLRRRSPVSPPWYFDAVLHQSLSSPRSRRRAFRWIVPLVVTVAVSAAAAYILVTPDAPGPAGTREGVLIDSVRPDTSTTHADQNAVLSQPLSRETHGRRPVAAPPVATTDVPSGSSDEREGPPAGDGGPVTDAGAPPVGPAEPPADTAAVFPVEIQPRTQSGGREEISPDSTAPSLPVRSPPARHHPDSGRAAQSPPDSSGTTFPRR